MPNSGAWVLIPRFTDSQYNRIVYHNSDLGLLAMWLQVLRKWVVLKDGVNAYPRLEIKRGNNVTTLSVNGWRNGRIKFGVSNSNMVSFIPSIGWVYQLTTFSFPKRWTDIDGVEHGDKYYVLDFQVDPMDALNRFRENSYVSVSKVFPSGDSLQDVEARWVLPRLEATTTTTSSTSLDKVCGDYTVAKDGFTGFSKVSIGDVWWETGDPNFHDAHGNVENLREVGQARFINDKWTITKDDGRTLTADGGLELLQNPSEGASVTFTEQNPPEGEFALHEGWTYKGRVRGGRSKTILVADVARLR